MASPLEPGRRGKAKAAKAAGLPALFIVGSGSQARYVIDIVASTGSHRIVGIADLESDVNVGRSVNGVPIRCVVDDLPGQFATSAGEIVVAYGDNRRKAEIAVRLAAIGYRFATVIHPLAWVSPTATIGPGCIVNPYATLMPNARVQSHVILHSQVNVDHDCVIGDYSNLAPGVTLAGGVTVGQGVTLYTGANVLPRLTIGDHAIVGAGALVHRDVAAGSTVVGVPARAVRR
jgi:UDP-perosamine 4-acetyltransferase